MEKTDIINAYLEIRKTNNTIPDEVLDFMKDCAIQKLSLPEQEEKECNHNNTDVQNLRCNLCLDCGKILESID